MRKKLSLVTVGLLAGAAMSIGPVSPASAQPERCASTDPVLDHVCDTIGNVRPWAEHYYYVLGEAVKDVYCTVWPDLCV